MLQLVFNIFVQIDCIINILFGGKFAIFSFFLTRLISGNIWVYFWQIYNFNLRGYLSFFHVNLCLLIQEILSSQGSIFYTPTMVGIQFNFKIPTYTMIPIFHFTTLNWMLLSLFRDSMLQKGTHSRKTQQSFTFQNVSPVCKQTFVLIHATSFHKANVRKQCMI